MEVTVAKEKARSIIFVTVVKYGEELLFESQGIYLDQLDARDYDRSDIEVIRNGVSFTSGYTLGHGTMDYTSFFSLKEIKPDSCPNHCSELFPEDFLLGDEIVFEFDEMNEAMNIKARILERYRAAKAREAVVKELPNFDYNKASDEEINKAKERFLELFRLMSIPEKPIFRSRRAQ